ncbi:ArsC family reductase [Croceicoccus marinus]|uniref:Arsenate reductase n=1 Tax=Croceicoccus marinus TaxID=450378 RepID=A0A1Z1F7R4_9SPHN|nr:ArsC family reductase [Croceicoccus marinus]ARU14841.1 arsenate reductase [Croceicoccus marinus]
MTTIVYGIPNCDTVKKARNWLDDAGIAHAFHDYRKQGVPEAHLKAWIADKGWEPILNKRGTTFRKLPDEDRQDIDAAKAEALLMANPSMIKRPIVEHDGGLLVGFDAGEWSASLK